VNEGTAVGDVRPWSQVRDEALSPARRKKVREAAERAANEIEMSLRGIRESVGKTQVELASLVDMTQSELSRMERREDHRLSTLRRYANALGGEVKVIIEVRGKRPFKLQFGGKPSTVG